MDREKGEEVKRLAEQHREQLGAVQRQFRQANVKVTYLMCNLREVSLFLVLLQTMTYPMHAGNDRPGEEELKRLVEQRRRGKAGPAAEKRQGADGRRARGGHSKLTGM